MFRLVGSLDRLPITHVTPLSGPSARGSGSNTDTDGIEHTFETFGNDLVSFRIQFTPKKGRAAREERGLLTAALIGGNAMRFKVPDPDRMTPAEAGIVGAYVGQNWSNGRPWSNGQPWQPSYPNVAVAGASAVDTSTIYLADQFWGHDLTIGDRIGFFPFHFGSYEIVQVFGDGQYGIWPRLRRAVTTANRATQRPVMVVRPMGKSAVSLSRGVVSTENQSVDVIEVIDPYVRQYFTG